KIQEIKEMKDTVRNEEAQIEQSELPVVPELADSEIYQNMDNYVDQSYQEVAAAIASWQNRSISCLRSRRRWC
ncbi:hypothetical protein LV454_29965, partial [Escherichia coli]|nr:hypothetical protein [Escherichia coli]